MGREGTAGAVLLLLQLVAGKGVVPRPEEYVDTRFGSKGTVHISQGNLFPQVVTPWGMNSWTVMTDSEKWDGGHFFHPWDWSFHGIKCTHQPSPWLGDWGHFTFLPILGYRGPLYNSYNPEGSVWRPYHFKAGLTTYSGGTGRTTVEVTSSNRGAVLRTIFPSRTNSSGPTFDQRRLLTFTMTMENGTQSAKWSQGADGRMVLEGYVVTRQEHDFRMERMYYSIEVETEATPLFNRTFKRDDSEMTLVTYDADGDVFVARVGTSLVGVEQARLNREREVGGLSFEEVLERSKAEWRELLSKVEVRDVGNQGDAELRVLYTALYRASLNPRFTSEEREDGTEIHRSTYAVAGDVVREGPQMADSGSWDSYRSVYPMHSLLNPTVLGRMIAGWLNAYREGGTLPQWSSPGYRNIMVGTMTDCFVADAIVNEVGGFDVELAYEAIRKDAFNVTVRRGMQSYLDLGYVQARATAESVSITLNHMLADWSIAQAARKLNKTEDYEVLMARARNYAVLFNKATGFFQAKDVNGSFDASFDQYEWGGGGTGNYTEGGPWQYRFYVPHDPKGLAALYREAGLDLCEKLEEMQTTSSAIHLGRYYAVTHEMTEMVNNCWGQYAHNNQPVHHVLYMFIASSDSVNARCAQVGQSYLRRVVTELYKASVDMFPGDEDNGSHSSWFVLSALGLYQLAPGSGVYTLGIPLFRKVVLLLDNGNKLVVRTNEPDFVPGDDRDDRDDSRSGSDGSDESPRTYDPTAFAVEAVTFNGVRIVGTTIPYATLMGGGELYFHLRKAEGHRGHHA